jgi:type II secretory ATPase GspE/PulE/Tfp pilus assembly ATPase PilB-like protein
VSLRCSGILYAMQRYSVPMPHNNTRRAGVSASPWAALHSTEDSMQQNNPQGGSATEQPFPRTQQGARASVTALGSRKRGFGDALSPAMITVESEQYAKLFVRDTINAAIADGASDIHFEPMRYVARVRFRVDGVLVEKGEIKIEQYHTVLNTIKVLADIDIAEHALPQDGHIELSVREKGAPDELVAPHDDHEHFYDVRVSTFPSVNGEAVVMRLLNRKHALISLEDLGMNEAILTSLREAIRLSYGMILVTGPTGSGKTTTLYSVLSELKSDERNIITLEDPIEFHLEWMRQCEIREQRGFTYEVAMRSVLRQDPDVLMIGEIRGAETAEQAVRSALVGRIVGSTLHANTAVGTIARLLDLGVSKSVLVHAVRAIIAQRLVRKVCDHCRVAYTPDPIACKYFGLDPNNGTYYTGAGCDACNGTGFKGRTGIFSVMLLSQTLQNMIFEGHSLADIQEQAIAEGMQTLKMSAVENVLAGITTVEEVARVV